MPSTVIRNFLGRDSSPFAPNSNAPVLIVSTPTGQLHELGAVMVAAAASDMGWRVIYLGPSLPAADIAAAARQHEARAVAVSIVYPEDDPDLPAKLENLRKYLPVKNHMHALAAGPLPHTPERFRESKPRGRLNSRICMPRWMRCAFPSTPPGKTPVWIGTAGSKSGSVGTGGIGWGSSGCRSGCRTPS